MPLQIIEGATACIDACQTEAITGPYQVDGSKCISYLTIELKDALPNEFKGKMDDWMFGCDVCQDVCPWNKFSKSHQEPLFNPHPELLKMTSNNWKELTNEIFKEILKIVLLKEQNLKAFSKNINFLKEIN